MAGRLRDNPRFRKGVNCDMHGWVEVVLVADESLREAHRDKRFAQGVGEVWGSGDQASVGLPYILSLILSVADFGD
jgi:hypothetical protein